MSNDLQVIETELRSLQPMFESVAADKSMVFERELEFAMQILSSNDYTAKLAFNSIQSIKDCVTNVAAIGISLNPAKKQSYLVPRNGKVCLDIGYMGLIDMAVSTGSIRWAQAAVVYRADKFTLNGYDKAPTHTFEPFSAERGDIIGMYVVAKTADGDYLTHTMSIKDVHAIRDRSEAWKSGRSCPWRTDEAEMVKKTGVKQASKYWPKTERLDKAIHYLNTDGGEGIEFAPTVQEEAPRGKPAVSMPQAKRPQADTDNAQPVTDVEPKNKPVAQHPVSSELASAGEINYIHKRLVARGMTIAAVLDAAGMDAAPTLTGLTKDGFIALRDITK